MNNLKTARHLRVNEKLRLTGGVTATQDTDHVRVPTPMGRVDWSVGTGS